ncbi:MAG: 2Fe-2S iron-sulfur cluster binding domain-containing protein, partial [Lachnospiraceae bacterium]|nr:2Fe-2S iron-sulfur cluster binding domain-containing protein [Lachnospiraceae bacterium]
MAEVYTFFVNGLEYSVSEDKKLLRFLRDDLHLHSVKDGCSEGACGTCTVVIDGKATKACCTTTKKVAGKHVITVEGLSDFEKEAYVYGFGVKGAVQCGFCTPGMVMSAKALLDANLNPTEDEIKAAIRGNICRCTGYKKIIEGIMLTAAILRGDEKIDPEAEAGGHTGVGGRGFRVDVRPKVLGYGEYPDDIEMDGMVHASAVRSKYPRARVLSIDASEALATEGVIGVLTAEDVPNNKVGHIQQDWDVMIAVGDITRCVGDAICLVVAENETILASAKDKIKIEYEVLEPVRNCEEAAAEGAPLIHSKGNLCQSRHVTRGDAKKALAESAFTVTETFETPFTE